MLAVRGENFMLSQVNSRSIPQGRNRWCTVVLRFDHITTWTHPKIEQSALRPHTHPTDESLASGCSVSYITILSQPKNAPGPIKKTVVPSLFTVVCPTLLELSATRRQLARSGVVGCRPVRAERAFAVIAEGKKIATRGAYCDIVRHLWTREGRRVLLCS